MTFIFGVLWGPSSVPPPLSMALPGPSPQLSWLFSFLILLLSLLTPPSPCRPTCSRHVLLAGEPLANLSKLVSSKTLYYSRPALMLTLNGVPSGDSAFDGAFPRMGFEDLQVSCLHNGFTSHPKGHFYLFHTPIGVLSPGSSFAIGQE